MRVADAVQALPGLILIGLLPGFLLATALVPRWRWWERLAMAPGLAAGLAGTVGLLWHDLGIPFSAAIVLPLTAPLALAAAWRWRASALPGGGRGELAVVAAALVAGLVTGGVAVAGLRGQPVPVWDDPTVHGLVATGIARTHDTLPVLSEPVDHTAWVRAHTGFEATAALVSEIGGPSPAASMVPLVLLAIVLLPMGLAALALETTRSRRIAALVTLLGVGMVFPTWPMLFGEYPLVVDSTLVVPIVVALHRLVRGSRGTGEYALLAVLAISVWVIHGLEGITAAVVGGPLIAGTVLAGRNWRRALPPLVLGVGAVLLGMLVAMIATRLPSVPPGYDALTNAASSEADITLQTTSSAGLAAVIRAFTGSDLPATLGVILLVAGYAAALRLRRLRWAVVVNIGLLLALFDVSSGFHLHSLWKALYPWSVADRLLGIQYWVVPLVLALGAVAASDVARKVLEAVARGEGKSSGPRLRRPVLTAGALVATVGAVTLLTGARHDSGIFEQVVASNSRVSDADLAVMTAMASRLPRGAVVMNDGEADAGLWIGVFTPQVTFFSKTWLSAHPDDPRLVALSNACADPTAASRALDGVNAVFIGAKPAADALHVWTPNCIGSLPGLNLLAQATDSTGRRAIVYSVGRTEAPPVVVASR